MCMYVIRKKILKDEKLNNNYFGEVNFYILFGGMFGYLEKLQLQVFKIFNFKRANLTLISATS